MGFDQNEMEQQIASADPTKREIRRGLLIATAFFGIMLGGAALIPLDAGAGAQGIVAVSGSRQLVQHREGGLLTELLVKEGQLVKQGDKLAVVSQSGLVADERSLTSQVIALLAQRQRLQAQLLGRDTIEEPAEFAMFTGPDRELASQAMQVQRQVLTSQRTALGSQRLVLGQRANQSESMISAAEFQAKANREQRRLIGEELDGMRELEKRGFVSKNRIRELERMAAQLDGEYGALVAEMNRGRQAIGESKMQSLSIGSQDSASAAQQLHDVEVRLAETQPRLAAAREQLDQATLRAPASGHVVDLKVHTIGGVVTPGQVLMQVVPGDRQLVIEAKVPPNETDSLHTGMIAQVHFSSLHDRNLPPLDGTVTRLSADALEDERSGMLYFTIQIVVPASELDKIRSIHGESAIRAGIPADVMIPLRKRTALSYLLDPIFSTFWKSGRER